LVSGVRLNNLGIEGFRDSGIKELKKEKLLLAFNS
jgi:hypothetical protein